MVAARAGADDGNLRRSLRHIGFDHLREQDGDHVHANPACTGDEDSLQRHGATVQLDNHLQLFGRHHDWNSKPVRRDRLADPHGGMSFKRYTRELYDHPKTSLLPLKARMVRSKVVEALLYECVWHGSP